MTDLGNGAAGGSTAGRRGPRAKGRPQHEAATSPPAEVERLLAELEVHRVELEMQNEELRAAHAEAEAGLRRYTELYDFAPVSYLTLAPDGTILEANVAASSLLKVPRSQLRGQRLGSFTSGQARSTLNLFLAKVFAGQARESCELELRSADQSDLTAHVEASADPTNQACRVALADITERIRAEDERRKLENQVRESQMAEAVRLASGEVRTQLESQLRKAGKLEAVGTLAAGIAHDFNNLLTAVIGYADLLDLEFESSTAGHEDLVQIRFAAERASALTRQLLTFARRDEAELRPLGLGPVVLDIYPLLRRLLSAEIEIVMTTEDGLWPVRGDPGQVEQILVNLALNAQDAMPTGGKLTFAIANVEVRSEGSSLWGSRWVNTLDSGSPTRAVGWLRRCSITCSSRSTRRRGWAVARALAWPRSTGLCVDTTRTSGPAVRRVSVRPSGSSSRAQSKPRSLRYTSRRSPRRRRVKSASSSSRTISSCAR
jgi:signal transduction histidine kinase